MSQDDSAPLTRDIAPFGVRMPPDLKERVQAAAKANSRSMNAEIVATLEEKYPRPSPDDLAAMLLTFLEYSAARNPPPNVMAAIDGIRRRLEAASPDEANQIAEHYVRELAEDLERPVD